MSADTAGGDGYYFRPAGSTEARGPYTASEFAKLQRIGSIRLRDRVWRQSAGHVYRVSLTRRFVKDKLLSCAACNHIFEVCAILTAGGMTVFAFSIIDCALAADCALLRVRFQGGEGGGRRRQRGRARHAKRPPRRALTHPKPGPTTGEKEKDETGKRLVLVLSVVTFGMVLVTLRTLYRRWQSASSDVFVSEV